MLVYTARAWASTQWHRPANKYLGYTRHSTNAVWMLGQRRRRWSNIETVLSECFVFAGRWDYCIIFLQICRNTMQSSNLPRKHEVEHVSVSMQKQSCYYNILHAVILCLREKRDKQSMAWKNYNVQLLLTRVKLNVKTYHGQPTMPTSRCMYPNHHNSPPIISWWCTFTCYNKPRKANHMSSQSWANTSLHCWPVTICYSENNSVEMAGWVWRKMLLWWEVSILRGPC